MDLKSFARSQNTAKKYPISENAAILQNYNNELVKYVTRLSSQKDELNATISKQEMERESILATIEELNNKLQTVNKNITDNQRRRDMCERTLQETDLGYQKILESLNVLLCVAQKDKEIIED